MTVSIDPEELVEAVKSSMFGANDVGYCLACGEEAQGCESDGRKQECESCGEFEVYGAEELMFMGFAPF